MVSHWIFSCQIDQKWKKSRNSHGGLQKVSPRVSTPPTRRTKNDYQHYPSSRYGSGQRYRYNASQGMDDLEFVEKEVSPHKECNPVQFV